jgi:uncharacterized protein
MTYEKPLPFVTPATAPFWDSLREHGVRMPRCADCGAWVFPIAPVCQACWSESLEWHPLSGRGSVSSWVVYHRAFHPGWSLELPYNVVQVDMDEGMRFISNLVDIAPEEITEGMSVVAVYDDVTPEATLLKFRRLE